MFSSTRARLRVARPILLAAISIPWGRRPRTPVFSPWRKSTSTDDQGWAAEWIAGLVARQNVALTPSLKTRDLGALGGFASVGPREQRTLTLFRALVQNAECQSRLGAVYAAPGLMPTFWMPTPQPSVTATGRPSRWRRFTTSRPPFAAPLDYIFHRLEKRFDGRPTLLMLDEAWLFLDDPLFADKIREWLKTLRRRNVSVVFASQSLDDIAEKQNCQRADRKLPDAHLPAERPRGGAQHS